MCGGQVMCLLRWSVTLSAPHLGTGARGPGLVRWPSCRCVLRDAVLLPLMAGRDAGAGVSLRCEGAGGWEAVGEGGGFPLLGPTPRVLGLAWCVVTFVGGLGLRDWPVCSRLGGASGTSSGASVPSSSVCPAAKWADELCGLTAKWS